VLKRWTPTVCVLLACTSPTATGTIEDEPVCPDFTLGGSAAKKMKGSLRRPVKVTVLEGGDVRWERVLLGKRSQDAPASRFVVQDDDETYIVRWAQCSNVFAPKRVEEGGRAADSASSYACGEATVYKEEKLDVREGDASSRVVRWVPPPEADCWKAEGSTESPEKPEKKTPK
jgi:hypothetical protein